MSIPRFFCPTMFAMALAGCASVSDIITPDVAVRIPAGTFASSGDLEWVQPETREQFLGPAMLDILSSGEANPLKNSLRVEPDQSVSFEMHGAKRSGLVWIIPPLGALSIDTESYVIVKQPDGLIVGFAVNGHTLTCYSVAQTGQLTRNVALDRRFRFERSHANPPRVLVSWPFVRQTNQDAATP